MNQAQFEALLRHLSVQNALLYQILVQMRGENTGTLRAAMAFLDREVPFPLDRTT